MSISLAALADDNLLETAFPWLCEQRRELQLLDERMEQLGLFYVRYMDDIIVFAPTRWNLRKAVRVMNQTLDGLRLKKHPEKTFIGKIEARRGHDLEAFHEDVISSRCGIVRSARGSLGAGRTVRESRGFDRLFPRSSGNAHHTPIV